MCNNIMFAIKHFLGVVYSIFDIFLACIKPHDLFIKKKFLCVFPATYKDYYFMDLILSRKFFERNTKKIYIFFLNSMN